MFRLALALGRTVNELLGTISSDEISEWQAYDRIEPFGSWRDDLRIGTLTAVVANGLSGSGEFRTEDFMLDTRTKEERVADDRAKALKRTRAYMYGEAG